MPQAFRNTLLTLRDLIVSAGPLAFLALGLLVAAYWWLNPNPPNQVTLATGPAQSAYEEFGKRYQKALAADGIEVVLVADEQCCGSLTHHMGHDDDALKRARATLEERRLMQ